MSRYPGAVHVLVAIVKKRLNLSASLYQILQILSLTMFERMQLNKLLSKLDVDSGIEDCQPIESLRLTLEHHCAKSSPQLRDSHTSVNGAILRDVLKIMAHPSSLKTRESHSDTGRPASRERPFRWLCDTISFYSVLTLLAVCFSSWSLLAFLLSFILPRRFGNRLGQAAINLFFSFFLATMRWTGIARCDLSALDGLREERGIIFIANHLALLDILLLGSRLPCMVCIIKADLWNNPLLGGGRLAGYIRNDDAVKLVRRSSKTLREGSNLLIFPEGTRNRGGQICLFKPGFALIARQAQAAIQPIFIKSNSLYLSKGWPLWRRPTFPLMYSATLGNREYVDERADVFSNRLQATFCAKLQ